MVKGCTAREEGEGTECFKGLSRITREQIWFDIAEIAVLSRSMCYSHKLHCGLWGLVLFRFYKTVSTKKRKKVKKVSVGFADRCVPSTWVNQLKYILSQIMIIQNVYPTWRRYRKSVEILFSSRYVIVFGRCGICVRYQT